MHKEAKNKIFLFRCLLNSFIYISSLMLSRDCFEIIFFIKNNSIRNFSCLINKQRKNLSPIKEMQFVKIKHIV